MAANIKPTARLRMVWILDVVLCAACFCWWIIAALQAGGNGSGAQNHVAAMAVGSFFLSLIVHFVLSIALAGRIVANRGKNGSSRKSSALLSAGLILGGLVLMLQISMLVLFFLRISV